MNSYKRPSLFISLVCVVALVISLFSGWVVAEDTKLVTATTNASVKQGYTGTCYVYISSTESLAALDVMVHFDPQKVKISSLYNSVSCKMYDSAKNTDNITFSYLLDGKGTASKTRLFYFTYQVLSNAEVGNTSFDITIGEAYDSSLNNLSVSGSRCSFTVAEAVTNKTCSLSGSSSVETKVEEEFSLSYRFSTYQLASGSAVLTYDPELFQVVEITKGAFLDNKMVDINQSLAGSVYLSFLGTQYTTKYDFFTVKFKTLQNKTETASIGLKLTELCDKDLNNVSCKEYTTNVTITHNPLYLGDAPKMSISAVYHQAQKQVVATVNLEENSHLGAGDFVVKFNPELLTLSSYQQECSADFFTVNQTQAAEGIFKFYVISLKDIVAAQKVITLTFNAAPECSSRSALLDLEGSLVTDSLTNAIGLNFVDAAVTLVGEHTYDSLCDTLCNQCWEPRQGMEPHSFTTGEDTLCDECGYVRTLESVELSRVPNRTSFVQNEELDLTGGVLTLCYSDQTTGEVPLTASMVHGFNPSLIGEQTVEVVYGTFVGNYTVRVVSQSLEGIAVTTLPNKVVYKEGEALLLDGMVVTASYSGGTTEIVSEYTVSGFDGTLGEKTITITFAGKTATFTVVVEGLLPGDVTGDNALDNKDLSELLRYLNNWNNPIYEQAADVNDDGLINNMDFALLQRYLNDWDVTLK